MTLGPEVSGPEVFGPEVFGPEVSLGSLRSGSPRSGSLGPEAFGPEVFFGCGASTTPISEIEFDESTQRYQGQISMTIVAPSSGAPIGAVTFDVDPEAL